MHLSDMLDSVHPGDPTVPIDSIDSLGCTEHSSLKKGANGVMSASLPHAVHRDLIALATGIMGAMSSACAPSRGMGYRDLPRTETTCR